MSKYPALFANSAGTPLPFDVSLLDSQLQEVITGTIKHYGGVTTNGGDGIAPNFVLVEPEVYRKTRSERKANGILAHEVANVVLHWKWVDKCIGESRFLGVKEGWGGYLVANRATSWREVADAQALADAEFAASFQNRSAPIFINPPPRRNPLPLPVPDTSPPLPNPKVTPEPTGITSTHTSPTLFASSPAETFTSPSYLKGELKEGDTSSSEEEESPKSREPVSPPKRKRASISDVKQPRKKSRTVPKAETPVVDSPTQPERAAKAPTPDIVVDPPPMPPTVVVASQWFGNDFTAEDRRYLKEYIDYICVREYNPDFKAMFVEMAKQAPQHNYTSWKNYFYKNERAFAEEIPSLRRLYESSSSEDESDQNSDAKPAKSSSKRRSTSRPLWQPQVTSTISGTNGIEISREERRALIAFIADAPEGIDDAELLQNFARMYTRYSWRAWQSMIKNNKESFDRAILRRRTKNSRT